MVQNWERLSARLRLAAVHLFSIQRDNHPVLVIAHVHLLSNKPLLIKLWHPELKDAVAWKRGGGRSVLEYGCGLGRRIAIGECLCRCTFTVVPNYGDVRHFHKPFMTSRY